MSPRTTATCSHMSVDQWPLSVWIKPRTDTTPASAAYRWRNSHPPAGAGTAMVGWSETALAPALLRGGCSPVSATRLVSVDTSGRRGV